MPDLHRDDGYDPDRWDARFIILRDGPRELEDGVYRRTLASLNSGWFARGGLLRLHDDHLSFTPILGHNHAEEHRAHHAQQARQPVGAVARVAPLLDLLERRDAALFVHPGPAGAADDLEQLRVHQDRKSVV